MLTVQIRQRVKNESVKLGDQCQIIPLGGNRRRYSIDRHSIDILPHDAIAPVAKKCWKLPNKNGEKFHYQLLLNPDEGCLLRTLHGSPFVINGQLCREAYVEKGDQLFLGDTEFRFQHKSCAEEVRLRDEPELLVDTNQVQSILPVLIEGETGTGKTRLARLIHERSGRGGAFVHVNLSAFSASLIESELFGHKKGAFTGAVANKTGAIRSAHRGTLFLDEIDSLSLELQTKLLLFLDNQVVRPVGSEEEFEVECRLIFAAGKELKQLVARQLMRADFYHRLSCGLATKLPSLRTSPKLIRYFCERWGIDHNMYLTERLLDFYQTLPWSGNYRQLKGHLMLKRQVNKGRKLDFDQWDEKLLVTSSDLSRLGVEQKLRSLNDLKSDYIKLAYQKCHGNMRQTCTTLGIGPKTLRAALRDEFNGLECKPL